MKFQSLLLIITFLIFDLALFVYVEDSIFVFFSLLMVVGCVGIFLSENNVFSHIKNKVSKFRAMIFCCEESMDFSMRDEYDYQTGLFSGPKDVESEADGEDEHNP